MNREELISQFMEWSKDLGLAVTILQDPTTDFHIVVSEQNLPAVDIIHPKIDSKFVLFGNRVTVSEVDRKKIMNLIPEEHDDLLWDIRFKLISSNIEFTLLNPKGTTTWQMHFKVFLEDLSEQSFADFYMRLKNAALTVIWSYRRILDRKSIP